MNFKKFIFIILSVYALGTGEKLFSAAQTPSMGNVEKNNEENIFEELDNLDFIPLPGQEKYFLELPVSEEGSIVSPVEIIDVDNEVKIKINKKRKRSDDIYLPIHAVIHSPETLNEGVAQTKKPQAVTQKNICDWPGCGKNFSLKGNLNHHKKIHTREKSFKCKKCNESFIEKNDLNDHRKTHIGERPFECKKCPKRFTKKSGLDDHKRTHSGEKPFECAFCGKKCTQKSNLKAHLKIHTKEKSFTVEQPI